MLLLTKMNHLTCLEYLTLEYLTMLTVCIEFDNICILIRLNKVLNLSVQSGNLSTLSLSI